MGERLLCKQEVIGSNPFTSTRGARGARRGIRFGWGPRAVAGGLWRLIDRVKRRDVT